MAKTHKTPEQADAELRKTIAEARVAELEAESKALELEEDIRRFARYRDKDAREDADDTKNGVYYFNTGVNGGTVKVCREFLNEWHRINPGQPVELVFNSPGGSVLDGLDLGDCIENMIDQGHQITTVIAGVAASMAGILLQFGSHRVIGRNSWLHLHEVSTGASGKASDLKDSAELAERLTLQACDIYARKSKLSAKQIHNMMKRQEVWLTPAEALKHGFVDEVR